uniref:Global nitrogen transcriptional regulator n=1 Tax=Dicranema revolutum TaxID=239144 RepID=A0A4D6WR97_9FLOR|nr:global nitrogen transcriptional regulator [Dicranema revolutum]
MKWINEFLKSKIPFYIYKLRKNDSIVYTEEHNNTSIIILYGIAYILKTFTNKESITLAILESGNIIHNYKPSTNYYYKIIAITNIFLLSFQLKDILNLKNYSNHQTFSKFIKLYNKTEKRYEMMHSVLAHKYIKNRLIQLILNLSQNFGIIKEKQIIIPYYISQINISIITGSNRTNINKILKTFYFDKYIEYSKNKHICIKEPIKLIVSVHLNKTKNQAL